VYFANERPSSRIINHFITSCILKCIHDKKVDKSLNNERHGTR
ncbi:hypothetical protein THOM_2957, partial [Trachipleistophora hominis]